MVASIVVGDPVLVVVVAAMVAAVVAVVFVIAHSASRLAKHMDRGHQLPADSWKR